MDIIINNISNKVKKIKEPHKEPHILTTEEINELQEGYEYLKIMESIQNPNKKYQKHWKDEYREYLGLCYERKIIIDMLRRAKIEGMAFINELADAWGDEIKDMIK